MMRFAGLILFSFVVISLIPIQSGAKKGKSSLITRLEDLKEFKKLLRTRTNLLVIFAKSGNAASKSMSMFEEVAEMVKGKATFGFVDCSDAKKLCKNLKASPSTLELRHYKDGDFNKNYDRKLVTKSLYNFLLDPTGDIPWDEEPDAGDVIHIANEQSFHKLIRKEKLPILAMFYAPWCGFCKRLKPDFAAAATEMKGEATLVGVDVDKPDQMALRAQYNITGFPTLYYFRNGQIQYKYGGENNKEGIIKWLKNPGPPEEPKKEVEWEDNQDSDVVHLHDNDFDDYMQNHPSVLVMFYAPWCGHCKKMKPEYEEAADSLEEQNLKGVLAAVDATKEKKLGEEYKIQGFPTVKYFKDGEFAFDFNERTKDKIVEFMLNPTEPPPPPPPEPKWEEVESDVVHLTEESFKSFLKKKKHCLVMFYAPWCGHCKKAKPEFMAAAAQFKDDTKVAFAAMDCTVHVSSCTAHDVTGYPTIKYFNYGKSSQKYMGGREEADFVKFMKDPLNTESHQQPPPPAPSPEEQWQDIEGHEDLHYLGAHNIDAFLQTHDSVLVMFYAPWCGHCKAMKPAFGEAARKLKADGISGVLATVDATVETTLAQQYSVRGYPTLKYFKNGKLAFDYKSGRTTDSFVSFMKDPKEPAPPKEEPAWNTVKSAVIHLGGDNFAKVTGEKDVTMVMFYAPWCGHCKKAKPEYQSAADQITDKNRIMAAVDCTAPGNNDLCTAEEVKGFPTIKLYVKGRFLAEYNGARTAKEMLDFVNNAPSQKKEEL